MPAIGAAQKRIFVRGMASPIPYSHGSSYNWKAWHWLITAGIFDKRNGFNSILQGNSCVMPMSPLGQKQTCAVQLGMSALGNSGHWRSLDYFVSAGEQRRWNGQTKSFGGG